MVFQSKHNKLLDYAINDPNNPNNADFSEELKEELRPQGRLGDYCESKSDCKGDNTECVYYINRKNMKLHKNNNHFRFCALRDTRSSESIKVDRPPENNSYYNINSDEELDISPASNCTKKTPNIPMGNWKKISRGKNFKRTKFILDPVVRDENFKVISNELTQVKFDIRPNPVVLDFFQKSFEFEKNNSSEEENPYTYKQFLTDSSRQCLLYSEEYNFLIPIIIMSIFFVFSIVFLILHFRYNRSIWLNLFFICFISFLITLLITPLVFGMLLWWGNLIDVLLIIVLLIALIFILIFANKKKLLAKAKFVGDTITFTAKIDAKKNEKIDAKVFLDGGNNLSITYDNKNTKLQCIKKKLAFVSGNKTYMSEVSYP